MHLDLVHLVLQQLTIGYVVGTDSTCHEETEDSGCNCHPEELLAAVGANFLEETSRLGGKGHHLIIHDGASLVELWDDGYDRGAFR